MAVAAEMVEGANPGEKGDMGRRRGEIVGGPVFREFGASRKRRFFRRDSEKSCEGEIF